MSDEKKVKKAKAVTETVTEATETVTEATETVTEATETVTEATETVTEATEHTSLTLNDLKALAQIIDLASTRGAFRGNELASVGNAYNKLTGFLAGVATQKPEQPAEATEATETAE